jgi:hypothetical protein
MQRDIFYEIVFFGSFHDIEMRNFKCKNIYSGSFQNEFILLLNTRLESIKESQKLTSRSLGVLFLLLGVLLALICFSLLSLQ